MLIEHTIKRHNGSHPKFADGTQYHFVPNAAGDHVADVQNQDHIDWFLSVSTFRAYKDQPKQAGSPPTGLRIEPSEPSAIIAAKVTQMVPKPLNGIRSRSA